MKFQKKISALVLSLTILVYFTSCAIGANDADKQTLDQPKNIIIFVSDGMGYNHLKATNYYQYGQSHAQSFEQPDWTHFALATYSSVMRVRDGDTVYSGGYNPQRASTDPQYLTRDATDSGAAGTALSTGKKAYNGSIGMSIYGDTLIHMSQAAKELGKATGIITSVQLSHATPASFIAHNEHRNNYTDIAKYILFHSQANVIMGAGNPDFNNNGQPAETNPQFVGNRDIWEILKANDGRTVFETPEGTFYVQDANGDGLPDPWTLIQTREEFQEMAEGPQPSRVFGVPQVHTTLQQGRTQIEDHTLPFQTPMNENVATLEEMTRAAINVLNQNPNGFFVMVEGGAVDWASHGNNSARMIEEQIDFNNSVNAAIEWVETYSSWDETLIIVTSDHECGYLSGPGDPDPLYPTVTNNGKGNLPGMEWHSGGHTNVLVPFFAKGPGAQYFKLMAGENDPVYGPFIQNTDIASLVFMMWGIPEIEVHKLN